MDDPIPSLVDDSTQSFVLRLWREETGGWRGRISHVQSGTQRGFTDLGQALDFVRQRMRPLPAERLPDRSSATPGAPFPWIRLLARGLLPAPAVAALLAVFLGAATLLWAPPGAVDISGLANRAGVFQGPRITAEPLDQTVAPGGAARFTAEAAGQPPPAVRWRVSADGGLTYAEVPGATSTTLAFQATREQDGNRYQAVFTNQAGTAVSRAAALAVR